MYCSSRQQTSVDERVSPETAFSARRSFQKGM
jgi:hypothetical protein